MFPIMPTNLAWPPAMFPKIKLRLKGQRFVFIEEIQTKSLLVLHTLMPADFNV
jgi:hypothetical protein